MRELKVIFGLIIIGFFACKKVETPPPAEGSPVFSIDAQLNGNDLNIAAGEDDYYLFSSYEIDEFNVRSFVATFAKIDCLDECQDTFRIKIRDAEIALPANTGNINDKLFIGNYEFRELLNPTNIFDTIFTYNLTLSAGNSILPGTGNVAYNWMIGDEVNTGFSDVLSTNLIAIPEESMPISLTLQNLNFGTACSKSVQLDFATGAVDLGCQTAFSTFFTPSGVNLVATPEGIPPFSLAWNTGATTDTIVTLDTETFYEVTVTDGIGCINSSSVVLDSIGTGDIQCQALFDATATVDLVIDSTSVSNPDSLQLSKVTLEYVDENDNFYATDIQEQPGSSYFLIQSLADFIDNENGEKTKRMEIEFNAILFNQNGLPALSLTQGNGKIAVAYPD